MKLTYKCQTCGRPAKQKRDKNRAQIIECVGCGRTQFLDEVENPQRPALPSRLLVPRMGRNRSGIITAEDIRQELARRGK